MAGNIHRLPDQLLWIVITAVITAVVYVLDA